MNPISLTVSGETKFVTAKTISELVVKLFSQDSRGIAVAVNDTVVSKSHWSGHELKDGDNIEIVKAVQGG